MKPTLSPALLGAGCALIASAALAVSARADSVVTINPDGSVAQIESAQDGTQQSFSNDAQTYEQNAGADVYANYGDDYPHRNNRGNSRRNTRPDNNSRLGGYNGYSGNGYVGGVNAASPTANSAAAWGAFGTTNRGNAYGNSRNTIGTRQGVQTQGRSTRGNATPLHRGGNGRGERDIIIDGDDNTVIIWPGNGYGYYPPYWGGYPIHIYPGYRGPGYGYPGYGYPRYGYPRYTNYYGLPPYVSAPNFGFYPSFGSPFFGFYAPGTYSHSYNGTINGGFGGFSVGKGGVNVNLGGGRQRVTSRSEMTVMPNTTVSRTAPDAFGRPSIGGSLSPFVMPNRGSLTSNQQRVPFSGRGNAGRF